MTELAAENEISGKTARMNPEQREVLDHRDSLCLSAGAGSGKTRTLVEKYLQLLLTDGREPAEILAITFTEKAAAEMQVRIRGELQKIIQSETDPKRCGDLEDKLMNLGGGWISTIHSFGARVLREHPAEAGIDPAFAPLPDQESQILWESAAAAAVLETVERDPKVGELALRLGFNSGQASRGASLISVLLTVKNQLEAQGRRPEEIICDESPAARTLNPAAVIRAIRTLTELPEPGATLFKKIPAWAGLSQKLSESPLRPDAVLRSLARAGWDEKEERLKPGGALKKMEKELFADLEVSSRMLAEQAAGMCEREISATLGRLLSAMWKNAEREKTRRRALDFSDLEIKTLRLFENHPEVTEAYQERFKHILVDEYQDVNFVQARIIRLLAGNRPRSLFAVGDPKQSIYKFRGADVEQFQTLWSEMEKREAAFALKSNYRSHPRLVRAVNSFFDGRIFCGNPPVRMEPGRVTPSPFEGDRPRIQWLSFDLGETNATERREREARILAEHIRQLAQASAGKLGYGDFALLFRATSSLYLYEEAMRRAQIPYELVKSGTAFRSQEVLDLLNALTVICDSSDKVSWLGFLRSPLAGLSDDGILALAESGDIRNYFLGRGGAARPTAGRSGGPNLNPIDSSAAEKTLRFIQQAKLTERKTRSPLSLLDWIISETGYFSILSGLPQSDARCRNVEILRAAAAAYGQHRPDPHIAFLETAWRMVDRNERETGMDPPASDRVKLMTIHQAKGLEFPVVILPDLLRSEPVRTPDFYVVTGSERLSLAARIKIAGTAEKFPTPAWKDAKDRAAVSDGEEQKRLLYVAMTRPQDLLILPGPDEAVKGHSVWEMLYQFLKEEREHVEILSAGHLPDFEKHGPPASLSAHLRQIPIRPAVPPKLSTPLPVRSATSFHRREAQTPERPKKRHAAGATGVFAVSLGTMAHEILEQIDLGIEAGDQIKQMRDCLKDRLRWISIPKKLADQLAENLENFFRSTLADRLRREAHQVWKEYPFTLILNPPGSESVRVRGKIDLLIFGQDGVRIYDYKYTDAGDGFGDYEGQLMAYALAACHAFDLDEVTVGLQFLTGEQVLREKPVSRAGAERALMKLQAD